MTTLRRAQLPILDVLPVELRREASPERCVCHSCAARLSDAQRAAYERVARDWRATRIAWCEAHGYQYLDLIRAELSTGAGTGRER